MATDIKTHSKRGNRRVLRYGIYLPCQTGKATMLAMVKDDRKSPIPLWMCDKLMTKGHCGNADCTFAHRVEDLGFARQTSRYKVENCHADMKGRGCTQYGYRCSYKHEADDEFFLRNDRLIINTEEGVARLLFTLPPYRENSGLQEQHQQLLPRGVYPITQLVYTVPFHYLNLHLEPEDPLYAKPLIVKYIEAMCALNDDIIGFKNNSTIQNGIAFIKWNLMKAEAKMKEMELKKQPLQGTLVVNVRLTDIMQQQQQQEETEDDKDLETETDEIDATLGRVCNRAECGLSMLFCVEDGQHRARCERCNYSVPWQPSQVKPMAAVMAAVMAPEHILFPSHHWFFCPQLQQSVQ